MSLGKVKLNKCNGRIEYLHNKRHHCKVQLSNCNGPNKAQDIELIIDNFKEGLHIANVGIFSQSAFVGALDIAGNHVPLRIFVNLLSSRRVRVSVCIGGLVSQDLLTLHLGGKVCLMEPKRSATFKPAKLTAQSPRDAMSQVLKIGKEIPEKATICLELELLPLDWEGQGDFPDNGNHDLRSDIASLRRDDKTADVKLICKGKYFLAHKTILSARSEVFAALFSHKGTTEDELCEINIEDCDHEAMEIFLSYMYGDALPTQDISFEAAKQLINVAKKYNVPSVMDMGEKLILACLNEDNAVQVAQLGELYNMGSLKKEAKAAIAASGKSLIAMIKESGFKLQEEQ